MVTEKIVEWFAAGFIAAGGATARYLHEVARNDRELTWKEWSAKILGAIVIVLILRQIMLHYGVPFEIATFLCGLIGIMSTELMDAIVRVSNLVIARGEREVGAEVNRDVEEGGTNDSTGTPEIPGISPDQDGVENKKGE